MQSGGKFIVMLLLIGVIAAVLFLVFGNRYTITQPLYEKVFGEKGEQVVATVSNIDNNFGKNIIDPPSSVDWCKVQEIMVGNNNEDYSRDRITGWDSIYNCCVRRVDGYNCALHKESFVEYCYTAHVGGVVKWVLVEGYYVPTVDYLPFITDLDKEPIENKPCEVEKYPKILQPIRNITAEYNPQ